MKLINKFIIFGLISSITTISVLELNEINNEIENNYNEENYSYISSNGYDLKVNNKTLYFEISKGDCVWSSGKLDESDNKTTSLRAAFIESPVTLYYITQSGGESNYSLNDENHAPYNRITFVEKSNGFAAKIKTFDGKKAEPNLDVEFTLNVRLNDNGVDIYISDLIENESKNKLSKIVFYPGFCSSYELNDGYFLIPDGNGAVIDLSKPNSAQRALNLKTYDYDYGISTYQRSYTSSQILSLPMYAINSSSNGMIAHVSSGAPYSELNAKVAGINDSYNYAYFDFVYRDLYYSYQGIAESSKKPVPQEEMNVFEPKISYLLFDKKMTYSDYANEYQNYLLKNNILKKSDKLQSNSRLEFLLSENRDGLFGKELINMTSLNFIKSAMNDLFKTNKNYKVSLLGYEKGGLSNSYPNCFPIENRVGSTSEFKKLSQYLNENNVDLNYVVDLIRSYENSNISSKKLAMNMSQKYIVTSDYYDGSIASFNRLTLDATKNKFKETNDYLKNICGNSLEFMSIGNALYSNHFNKKTSRNDAILEYKSLFNNYEKEVSFRKPNLYMFDIFDSYLSMPLESSHFMMESYDIPFLSMVLSGYKNMYVNNINLNFNNENIFLNMIDYNVYPSYLLTEKDAIELKDSMSSHIYSSKYDDWKDYVSLTEEKVVNTLKEIKGEKFISREMIDENIIKNKYNNGASIIINYSNNDYQYGGLNIPKKDFKLIYENE